MKITIDKEAGAAYIYLIDEAKKYAGISKKTITVDENINIDYDNNGNLVGIEILSLKIINLRDLQHLEYLEYPKNK